jgi:hypothetical protein
MWTRLEQNDWEKKEKTCSAYLSSKIFATSARGWTCSTSLSSFQRSNWSPTYILHLFHLVAIYVNPSWACTLFRNNKQHVVLGQKRKCQRVEESGLWRIPIICCCQVQDYIYWIISTENYHRHHHKFIKYEKRLRKEGKNMFGLPIKQNICKFSASLWTRLEHAHCLETINMWFLGKRKSVNAWKKADFDRFREKDK